ncbi:MAG: type VI secretion system tip protein VgrG [Myxococcales bacterium]|nr:type VI secretion system tip protein VgrG [Myxococcales bacterium]
MPRPPSARTWCSRCSRTTRRCARSTSWCRGCSTRERRCRSTSSSSTCSTASACWSSARTCASSREKTSVDIVKLVFERAGIDVGTCDFQVSRTLPKRVYCVQYRETDRDFSERLMDFEGIWTIPADEPDAAKTIFADDKTIFEPIEGEHVLPYVDGGIGTGVFDLEVTHSVITEEVVLRDYNYETPGVDLTSTAGVSGAKSSRYEFPGGYQTQADGKALAQIRLEEHLAQRTVAKGLAHIPQMRPGRTFDLTETTRDALNVTWLVRAVTHRYRRTGGEKNQVYECAFEASPADQAYRPKRRHKWPVVPGSHSIKVTGPAGEEIHTDSLGRMKGKFFWDREGKEDDKATCWMRVIQLPIGGSQALARVGWEMIVRYAYGDPDRPIAVCRVDNGAHTAPYSYPKAASAMSFKTLSSPGGGKYNEITMEDGGGGQKFGVTASKDWNEQVNNNKTEKIGANEKLEVGTTLDVTVGAGQTVKIGASRTCTISADAGVSVTGDRTKSVGASETVSISGSLTEKVAASDSESVGGNHMTLAALGVTRTSKGSQSLTVAGSMASIAGMGLGVMVAGAKSETVGGAKLVISGGAASENVIGAAALTVGGAIIHAAAGNRTASAKGTSRVIVGGVGLLNAGGKLQMKAKKIRFTVAGMANLLGGGGIVNLTPASATIIGLVTYKGSGGVKISGSPNLIT